MNNPDAIVGRLESRLTATDSWYEVKNNRIHYQMQFNKSIGIHWLMAQIGEASNDFSPDFELWKVRPSSEGKYTIEVREIDRRANIDKNQRDLTSF